MRKWPLTSQAFLSDLGEFANAAEYGKDVSDDDLAKLKSRLKKMAFTEEYAGTPLDLIYKGLDTFRPIEKKKSAESSRGGEARDDDTVIDFENVSTEQIDKWKNSDNPADKKLLEKYFIHQDKINS